MLTLRPYQQDLIDLARASLRKNRRAVLQAPTGAGKTALTVYMMQRAAEQGKRSMFIVHQNELLTQTSRALWRQKLEHGMVASGKPITKMPVNVASVQTLVNRLPLIKSPDLIIIDEAHRAAAASYKKVLEYWPDAMVIGLTATPQRTDGQGLGELFNDIVQGPTIRELISQGYLCDYELFAPSVELDLSGVKTTAGDYNKGQLEQAVDKPTITGDAVKHYKKLAMGKRCVVMCATLKHAAHVCERYNEQGINAAVIEGGMTNQEREKILDDFAAGRILVVCNVQLLIEGVDIPSIEVVQWLRPTQSLIVWMQGNGRGLRPSDGKDKLLILDHVQNWAKHGAPCTEREWSLDGREKGKRKARQAEDDVNVQQCGKCFHVFMKGPSECPKCGNSVQRMERKIDEKDGELRRVELEQARKMSRKEQGSARTLEELVKLGVKRGMKKPSQWAAITAAVRENRKPTADDFNKAREILSGL